MAHGYCCVRCGHEEEEHDQNLVNEPYDASNPEWFDRALEGFTLSLLECMDQKIPDEYLERVGSIPYFSVRFNAKGYQSPDPVDEGRTNEIAIAVYQDHSIVMIDLRSGCVFDIGS